MSRVSTIASTRQLTSLQDGTESVGYTCFAPNEERRAELCQALEHQRNLPRCNYVGRLVEQNAGCNPINDGTNKQRRSSKAMEKEREEIAKMKRNQRRKANMNERRERERTAQLDEDRTLKNEVFLSRFKKDPAQSTQ